MIGICGYGTLVFRERLEQLHKEQKEAKIGDFQRLLYPGKYGDDFLFGIIEEHSNQVIDAYGIFLRSGKGHKENERQLRQIAENVFVRSRYLSDKAVRTPQEQDELDSLHFLSRSGLFHGLNIGITVDLSERLRRLFYVASQTWDTAQYRVDETIRKVLRQDVGVSLRDIERIAYLTTVPDKDSREGILEGMRRRMDRLVVMVREKKGIFSWRQDGREVPKYLLTRDILEPYLERVEYPEWVR